MRAIQEAVAASLQKATGVRAVCGRTDVRGAYPLLAVDVEEQGTLLVDGGRQAEHTYAVTVTVVSDRDREETIPLMDRLHPRLLRGIPVVLGGEDRVLRPMDVRTEGETLTFSLSLCLPVPPLEEETAGEAVPMQRLTLEL